MSGDDFIWLADIGDGVDPLEVQAVLTKQFAGRVKIAQTTGEVEARDEAARRLRRFGATKVLGMAAPIEEALLRRGAAFSTIATVVNGMLRQLQPTPNELVIVDHYFFARSKDAPLADLVDELWAGIVEHVSSIIVVAKRDSDPALVSVVKAKAEARKKGVAFAHMPSEEFHDRFWIVDRAKGLLVGTSVNGLGKKYAVADYLDDADVAELCAELKALGLLS